MAQFNGQKVVDVYFIHHIYLIWNWKLTQTIFALKKTRYVLMAYQFISKKASYEKKKKN